MTPLDDPPIARSSAEIAASIPRFKDEARAICQEAASPGEALERLVREERLAEALWFVAYALPKRMMVWWATLCVGSATKDHSLDQSEEAVTKRMVDWVMKPCPTCGQHVREARESVGDRSPFARLADAFGPMAGTDEAHGRGLITAGLLSLSTYRGRDYKGTIRRFLELGLEVSRGEHLWPETADA
ncbi:hypothetical protein Pan216_23340 [Planctomycetes bacterium Pan216]|uniref:Uncharacterized protein n=1 Tax=Kolteria novifilia TaxID=2527975 RepID=A0A518B3F8_9BACT|nr:hypothetical protein Pan216_23340 [Planctomycetes bacterium Pan216]